MQADVLVLGGGPAGAWAAIEAAEAGASVILADKGHVGTSGATAAANTAVIDVEAGSAGYRAVMQRRLEAGLGLAREEWIDRALRMTRERLPRIGEWGYAFPADEKGRPFRGTLRGPDYMQIMRRRLAKLKVRLLDHRPATHLLEDDGDGSVAGACGRDRRTGEAWSVGAGAVVVATGGCAFMSKALGTYGLTGDGLLMAAEAGAALSGLEFSGQYGIAHIDATVTKNLIYDWATFSDESGRALQGEDNFTLLARHLPLGPVYAIVDKADAFIREGLRRGQPNIFLALERQGIDPFRQRFPVTLIYEGTVRGVGGIAIGADGATRVPGLFAAGDAASREPFVGAVSGGGGPNSTWAIASGSWAGQAAVRFSRRVGPRRHHRPLHRVGGPGRGHGPGRNAAAIRAIQDVLFPIERNFWRDGSALKDASHTLEELWRDLRSGTGDGDDGADIRSRETDAVLAAARWICAAGLARRETRGIHRRSDFEDLDLRQARPIAVDGVDQIRTWSAMGTA